MYEDLESVIICCHGKNRYTASIRFKDKSNDIDISCDNKYKILPSIMRIVKRVCDVRPKS